MTDSERKQRLAAALRENLKRRKEQAREAKAGEIGNQSPLSDRDKT